MGKDSWNRLSEFLGTHPRFCTDPKYVRGRVYYSRGFCEMNATGGFWAREFADSFWAGCDAVICMECGGIVMRPTYADRIAKMWGRIRLGVAYLITLVTGEDCVVRGESYYSLWSSDLAAYVDNGDAPGEGVVRIDMFEEKSEIP